MKDGSSLICHGFFVYESVFRGICDCIIVRLGCKLFSSIQIGEFSLDKFETMSVIPLRLFAPTCKLRFTIQCNGLPFVSVTSSCQCRSDQASVKSIVKNVVGKDFSIFFLYSFSFLDEDAREVIYAKDITKINKETLLIT